MGVGLDSVDAECEWTYAEFAEQQGSDEGHIWTTPLKCANGGICAENVQCTENGEEGRMQDVMRDGVDVGDVCVPQSEQEVDVAVLAVRSFKRLKWPASTLSVQPPGGRTLVNLDTIFFTSNDKPTTKVVTLAGQKVTIEASPTAYAWDFGDGNGASTTTPGHAYPDHDVYYAYRTTDPVSASVATTYAGRFRVGAGEWQAIEETVTVAGPAVDLEVLEARPQLVR